MAMEEQREKKSVKEEADVRQLTEEPPKHSNSFVEVVCKSNGKTWRFAAGTETDFAIKIINSCRTGSIPSIPPAVYIEAVKDGEEPVIFGPKSFLVNYGKGWKLQPATEPSSISRGCAAPQPTYGRQMRLQKEHEEKEDERLYKAQAHLYRIIKVARDEDLKEQIGKDIYFDLVDHDKVRSFQIQKQMPFNLFKEEVAKELGIPVRFQRFWIWGKRQNLTYRPHHPLTPQEELQTVGLLREVSDKTSNAELKLFLEVEYGLDLIPSPLPEKSKDDIIVFFKLYDPEKEEIRYVGRLFVKSTSKPIEILHILNEMAGFSPDQEVELFEEIKFESCVMCERLDTEASFRFSQIEDGDIICFQKKAPPEVEEQVRFPDVPSFLEYIRNRQVDGIYIQKQIKRWRQADNMRSVEPF